MPRKRMDSLGARGPLRIGAKRPAPVHDMDAPFPGLDDEPLEHAIAGISDKASRVEREHLLVALEPGARTKLAVERKAFRLLFRICLSHLAPRNRVDRSKLVY